MRNATPSPSSPEHAPLAGPTTPLTAGLGPLGVAALIIAALYVGREVFVPVALAILLSFVLAPLIRLLQLIRVPRALAVVSVVLVAFAAISGLAGLMASQVTQLAGDLPRYQSTMREKITSMRGSSASSGALERAADVLQDLGRELDKPQGATPRPVANPLTPGAKQTAPRSEVQPIPVEVRQPDPGALQTLAAFITPLVHPLATTGIVVIFVIFILLQREDLRNRLIRLAGTYDLQKTTAALDDAAARLSRLFLTQLALNTGFGLVIGMGLWLIGVPSPVLWGILAGVLRFVPYIGAVISAAFPLALATAVDPGWSMLIWTAVLFLVMEPLVGHVIEPMVYGHSTGLSPVAVIASATFWTWLWGPIGLVLAAPLTVCLVVLGRHVERLEFLDVMLGDRPALSPPEIFYQRVLAGDPAEAAEKAEEVLKERSLSAYYDEVALQGLRLARADAVRGVLDDARLSRILETVREVVDDLSDHADTHPVGGTTADAEAIAAVEATDESATASDLPTLAQTDLAPAFRGGEAPVLCVAGQGPLDEAAALMLAQLLTKHGLGVRVEAADALSTQNLFRLDAGGVALVCLCYLDASSPAHMRFAVRRLRRKFPAARIVLGCLAEGDLATAEQLRESAKADSLATSLRDVVRQCLDVARVQGLEGDSRDVAPPAATAA